MFISQFVQFFNCYLLEAMHFASKYVVQQPVSDPPYFVEVGFDICRVL
jgi:hypothetical protein